MGVGVPQNGHLHKLFYTLENASIYFSSLIAFALAIRLYTKDLDDDLSPDARESLSLRLMCLDEPAKTSSFEWASTIMDKLFGERHLSWRCFLISTAISIFSFTMIFLVLATAYPKSNIIANIFAALPFLLFIIGLINVPCDFFALLETRWIIKCGLPSFLKIPVDLVLTSLIALGWLSLLLALLLGPDAAFLSFGMIQIPSSINSPLFDPNLAAQGSNAILAKVLIDLAFFYAFFIRIVLMTSYVTSIWVWLHVISDLFIRFLSKSHRFVQYLNIETKPVRAIGVTISLFILLFGTAGYIIVATMI